MATLAVQDISEGGVVTMVAANAGGDAIPQGAGAGGWSQGVCLLVRNTDVAAKTVTVADRAPVNVPATTGLALIPVYGTYVGHLRAITYSAVTGVTVGAVRVSGD